MKRVLRFLRLKLTELARKFKAEHGWVPMAVGMVTFALVRIVFGLFAQYLLLCVVALVAACLCWLIRDDISAWLADNWRKSARKD